MGLHHHRFEVDPGGRDPSSTDPNNRYCFAWAAFDSQTTLLHQSSARTIAWASGHLYTGLKVCVLWYYQPIKGSAPGRSLNFHTHPAFGGWTQPENPAGVSPIALDNFGAQTHEGVDGLHLTLQAQSKYGRYHFGIVPYAEIQKAMQEGRAFTIALEFDIAATNSGKFSVWVDGKQVQQLTGIRTVFPGMTGLALWEGSYNSSGVPDLTHNAYAPARVGRSREECLRDGIDWPITEKSVWGSVSKATGAKAYRHVLLGELPASAYKVPAEWGGAPTPTPGGDFAWTPAQPVVAQPVAFAVVDPQPGVTYSWDRNLDGQSDATGLTYSYAYAQPGTKTMVLQANGVEVARKTIDIAPAPPEDPLGTKIVSSDSTTVTVGWTPPAEQWGYVPTIDGNEKLTDGKRHVGVGATANQTRIKRPADGQKHLYGVKILSTTIKGEVEA